MKIYINAIGKEKSKELSLLTQEYLKRFPWSVETNEFTYDKNGSVDEIKLAEGKLLLSKARGKLIALDEIGKEFSSPKLAEKFQTWMNDGNSEVTFLIGGANGHSQWLREQADLVLSLSQLTFAHKLVRLILAEQIYRVYSIIQGHPYHK